MMFNPDLIERLLAEDEHEHLELKEAKRSFHFDKLVRYCAALANEGGGAMVLGVTDQRPRRVVGTAAFQNLERTKAKLVEQLRLRVTVEEIHHPDGRVVIFKVPSRPAGVPIAVRGAYWMRAGADLVAMTPDQLRRIFEESEPDFTATICPGATLADLSPQAIEAFRTRWYRKAKAASGFEVSAGGPGGFQRTCRRKTQREAKNERREYQNMLYFNTSML